MKLDFFFRSILTVSFLVELSVNLRLRMKLGKSCVELHYGTVSRTLALHLLAVCFHSSVLQNSPTI